MSIAELCRDIVEELTKLGSPIADRLLPGLSDASIRGYEASLPFMFPDSIVEMYMWSAGTELRDEPGTALFPWWYFDPLPDSIEKYKDFTSEDYDWWNTKWFPFLSTSDISSFGICCQETRTKDGEIVCYEHLIGTHSEFVSLKALLQTIIEGYKKNVIFIGSEGDIDYDEDAFKKIGQHYNPGIEFWTE